jgi:hypothetical protein
MGTFGVERSVVGMAAGLEGGLLPIGVYLREASGVSPLKGARIQPRVSTWFQPWVRVLMRCALKGHQNAARRVEFISPQKRSVILAPLSGRILGWRIPRVETLG